MDRRLYLISRYKKFSSQFSIHFLIVSDRPKYTVLIAEFNPTRFLVTFKLRNVD